MADPRRKSPLLHLAGLALAAGLAAGMAGLWMLVPMVVRGTFLERIETLVLFLSAIAILTAAERLWSALATRGDHPPQD